MADLKCWRCKFRRCAGPRDVRERVRCVPAVSPGDPRPFWAEYDSGRRRDLNGSEVRASEGCARFTEVEKLEKKP